MSLFNRKKKKQDLDIDIMMIGSRDIDDYIAGRRDMYKELENAGMLSFPWEPRKQENGS